MSKLRLLSGALLASAAVVGLGVATAVAADDDFMKMAKDYIAQATAPVTAWDGPTSGPKSQGKKLVVYASADQRNGGASTRRWRCASTGRSSSPGTSRRLPLPFRPNDLTLRTRVWAT